MVFDSRSEKEVQDAVRIRDLEKRVSAIVGGLTPGSADFQVPLWLLSLGTYTPTQLTQDMILPGFAVSSFSNSDAPEVGESVVHPAFTISYATPATSAALTDDAGTPSQNLVAPFTSVSSTGTFVRNAYGQTYNFTLSAHKDFVSKAAVETITWLQKAYWGTAVPAAYNQAFITGLASNSLVSSRSTTFTVNAGVGEKIYYAFRSAYGTPTFWVGGFEGGFTKVATVSITNAHGFTENYDLWASDNVNLGSTTVQVI